MGPAFGFCVDGPILVATFLDSEDAVPRLMLSFAPGGGPPVLAAPNPPPLLLRDMQNFFFSICPLPSPVVSMSECGRLTWKPVTVSAFVWNIVRNITGYTPTTDPGEHFTWSITDYIWHGILQLTGHISTSDVWWKLYMKHYRFYLNICGWWIHTCYNQLQCMCEYVHVCLCVCVCVHVCTCTLMHMCASTCLCVCKYLRAYILPFCLYV